MGRERDRTENVEGMEREGGECGGGDKESGRQIKTRGDKEGGRKGEEEGEGEEEQSR